jgi:hypothetical protein
LPPDRLLVQTCPKGYMLNVSKKKVWEKQKKRMVMTNWVASNMRHNIYNKYTILLYSNT